MNSSPKNRDPRRIWWLVLPWLWSSGVFSSFDTSTTPRTFDLAILPFVTVDALRIVVPWRHRRPQRAAPQTPLHMGKGFKKARNKQADLAKKMALAKSQKQQTHNNGDETPSDESIDGEQKMRDDFEKLLKTTKGAIPKDDDAESAFIAPMKTGSKLQKKIVPKEKSSKQKEAEQLKQKQRLERKRKQQQIEAQRIHFESLIDVETSSPLGAIGAAKLVPWVPPFLKNGLIVIADPRANSKDMGRAMKYHVSLLDDNTSSSKVDVVFITADSVGETKAWMKRNEVDEASNLRILHDPDLSFMTKYEIIGDAIDRRWSMTMLAFDTNGELCRLERDVDPSNFLQLVSRQIQDLSDNKS